MNDRMVEAEQGYEPLWEKNTDIASTHMILGMIMEETQESPQHKCIIKKP